MDRYMEDLCGRSYLAREELQSDADTGQTRAAQEKTSLPKGKLCRGKYTYGITKGASQYIGI